MGEVVALRVTEEMQSMVQDLQSWIWLVPNEDLIVLYL